MSGIVLDASVVVAALFPGQFLSEAAALVEAVPPGQPMPAILRQEVVNASLRLVRRGMVSPVHATEALDTFDSLEWTFVETDALLREAYEVALANRQSNVFDAVYLLLARDLQAEMWTRDLRFIASFGANRPANLRHCPSDL